MRFFKTSTDVSDVYCLVKTAEDALEAFNSVIDDSRFSLLGIQDLKKSNPLQFIASFATSKEVHIHPFVRTNQGQLVPVIVPVFVFPKGRARGLMEYGYFRCE